MPVVYRLTEEIGLTVELSNGENEPCSNLVLSAEHSRALFERTGEVDAVRVNIPPAYLLES